MSNHLDLANLQTEITELRRRIASIEAARPNDAAADTIEQFCSRWGIQGALLRLEGRGQGSARDAPRRQRQRPHPHIAPGAR